MAGCERQAPERDKAFEAIPMKSSLSEKPKYWGVVYVINASGMMRKGMQTAYLGEFNISLCLTHIKQTMLGWSNALWILISA